MYIWVHLLLSLLRNHFTSFLVICCSNNVRFDYFPFCKYTLDFKLVNSDLWLIYLVELIHSWSVSGQQRIQFELQFQCIRLFCGLPFIHRIQFGTQYIRGISVIRGIWFIRWFPFVLGTPIPSGAWFICGIRLIFSLQYQRIFSRRSFKPTAVTAKQ